MSLHNNWRGSATKLQETQVAALYLIHIRDKDSIPVATEIVRENLLKLVNIFFKKSQEKMTHGKQKN